MLARFARHCVLALSCAPLVLLGACSEGTSDADDPAAASTSAGSSAEASDAAGEAPGAPVDIQLPEAARLPTVQGAKAFVRHWVDVLNRATLVGDAEALRALAPGCAECVAMSDGIDRLAAAGGQLETQGWRVLEVLAEPDAPAGTAVLALRVLRAPEAVTASAGAEQRFFEGGRERYTVRLARDGADWRITSLARWTS